MKESNTTDDLIIISLDVVNEDILIFVADSLENQLNKIRKRVFMEKELVNKPILGIDSVVLGPEATLEIEYSINLDFYRVVFDIIIDGKLCTLIHLNESDKIMEIDNLKDIDTRDAVLYFIQNADILSVMKG